MRTIYVFGSNRQGRHGKGCALVARKNFGAIYGQAEGLQGDSYAIVTKELRKGYPKVSTMEIWMGVQRFLQFANANKHLKFHLTAIGCGLAGYEPRAIAHMFRYAPDNVQLPWVFVNALHGQS